MCKISTTSQTHNGKTYTYYCVYKNGKRHTFKTKVEAESFVEEGAGLQKVLGDFIVEDIVANPLPISNAIATLKMHDCSISEIETAVNEYVSRLSSGRNASFGECVDRYLSFLQDRVSKSTRSCAAQACKIIVDHFGRDDKPYLHSKYEVAETLDQILPIDKCSPRTFNSIVTRLRTFARWSGRRGLSVDSNLFDSVELRNVPAKEPVFVSPSEIHALIEACKMLLPKDLMRHAAAYIALTFFAGIRRSEIITLKPEDFGFRYLIDNSQSYIRVSTAKGASRGRRGRYVPLEPETVRILREAFHRVTFGREKMKSGEIFKDGHLWIKKAAKLAEKMGLADKGLSERLKNTGHHSFITYHVARYDNIDKTVTICGTSKEMAAVHYKGLATKSEAEEYFAEASGLADFLHSDRTLSEDPTE